MIQSIPCVAALAILWSAHPAMAQAAGKRTPIKVFILAGQSNMQGHGRISMKKDGDLDYAAKQEQFAYLQRDGKWVERKDVWYFHKNGKGKITKSNLKVGLGANKRSIGPELAFGHVVGDHFDEQVLIIKTAWGGQALGVTFRPPSSKLPSAEALQQMLEKANKKKGRKNRGKRQGRKNRRKKNQGTNKEKNAQPKTSMEEIKARFGSRYRQVLEEVRMVLGDLDKHFPAYRGQGYAIAGFFWHQGWNDGCSKELSREYEANMTNFIADMRKDLGNEKLPFVIATSGMGGPDATGVAGWLAKGIEPKQVAAAAKYETCVAVPTRHFQKHKPGRQKSHWHNSAESYCLVGDAAGKAMIKLLRGK